MTALTWQAKMMAENIGLPDYIVDDKLLDEEYKNVIKRMIRLQLRELLLLGKYLTQALS